MTEVIITGATGYVGSETLDVCIADPAISKIYVISRHPLESSYDKVDKLGVIIHENWLEYDVSLLERTRNARACIW
jgi:1-deoxy-D-xylulose 5-phosphate reductoisomerase